MPSSIFRRTGVWGVAFVLIALIAYAPALDAGWIWDDDDYVTQNPLLRADDGLVRIWTEPLSLPQYYPLVHSSYWLESRLWGLEPTGYHVVNVILHALAAFVLALCLKRLSVPGAMLGGLIFLLHPLHVESAAWVTERKNTLSLLLALLALRAWLVWKPMNGADGSGRSWPWFAWLLFIGAMLSKTVVCALPAAIVLLTLWKRGRIPKPEAMALAPMFVIGFALAMVTVSLEKTHVLAEGPEWDLSAMDRLVIAGRAAWTYAGHFVFPANLSFNYPRWDVADPGLLASLAPWLALALVIGLFLARKRIGAGPVVGALIFGGCLLPALGFFDIYPMRFSFIADHFQYHANVAASALAAAGLSLVLGKRLGERLRIGASAALLVVLGALTFLQARHYEDADTLWKATLEANPRSWISLMHLGGMALDEERLEDAERLSREALAIEHRIPEAWSNLGVVLVKTERPDEARLAFETALSIRPDMSSTLGNLGWLAWEVERDAKQALPHLQRAVALAPDNLAAQALLGQVLHALGRHAEAVQPLQLSLAAPPPRAQNLHTMALCLRKLKREAKAYEAIQLALRERPDHLPSHRLAMRLAIALEQEDEVYRQLLRSRPHIDTEVISRDLNAWADRARRRGVEPASILQRLGAVPELGERVASTWKER